jgi:AcrR family transcriptional regulator
MNNSSSLAKDRSPRRQPKQKRGKERVEKILLAAATVFTEVGYAAATTQQIAERANAAIGSIYQFFPDKLAIFHALEAEHYQRCEGFNQAMSQLVPEADIHRPLAEIISELIDGYADFFAHPISRCVGFQFYLPHPPGLFVLFTQEIQENHEQQAIALHADFYQRRNPNLDRRKSELLAEVALNISRSLFMTAFKMTAPDRYQELFAELKALLHSYLDPHIGDRFIPDQPSSTRN